MRNKHEIFSLKCLSLALQTRFCSIRALRHDIEMIPVRTQMRACTVTQEDLETAGEWACLSSARKCLVKGSCSRSGDSIVRKNSLVTPSSQLESRSREGRLRALSLTGSKWGKGTFLSYQILRPERESTGPLPVKQEPGARLPRLLPEPRFLPLQTLSTVHTSVWETHIGSRHVQSSTQTRWFGNR